jgi:hypothetical protein
LTGHLLATERNKWDVVNLPAINDDIKPLWPERFSLEKLLEINFRNSHRRIENTEDFFLIDVIGGT